MAIPWTRAHFSERNPALKAYAITLVSLGLSQLIALVWFHPSPAQVGLGTSQHGEDAKRPHKKRDAARQAV